MIETSNKRDARPRSRAGWTRQRLEARQEGPPPRPDNDRPRWGRLGTTLGLVGLTAVTSWVVASISVWLVPVYVGAMVLIFAAPRKDPPKPVDGTEAAEASPVEDAFASQSLEARTSESDEPAAEPPASVAETEAPAEAPPKPRKRRVRARKSAKKGTEAPEGASESGRVTWVRVGPGKFVRSIVPVAEVVGPPAPGSEPEPEAASPLVDQSDAPAPEPAPIADEPPPEAESAPELDPDGDASRQVWISSGDPEPLDEVSEETVSPDPPEAVPFAGLDVSETAAEPPILGESPGAVASDYEAPSFDPAPLHADEADGPTSSASPDSPYHPARSDSL